VQEGAVPRALVIQDTVHARSEVAELARTMGYQVVEASSLRDARAPTGHLRPDLVLVDVELRGESESGDVTTLDEMADLAPGSAVVMVTDRDQMDTVVEAFRRGVITDCLWRPLDLHHLRRILAEVSAHVRLPARRLPPPSAGGEGRLGALVGRSKPMQRIYELIECVAPSSASVIIAGESGTGKELVARALHERSRRFRYPFEAVNCGAISPGLTETELFGHERGSFTGADRQHKGCFERAGRGTLFLDEITEMPLDLQVKLLRILETGVYMRVGGENGVAMEARVIAATNRSVDRALADGHLREDLYYRLKVFQIYLSPLRDRSDDIPLLVDHFLDQLGLVEGVRKQMSPEAMEVLCRYPWPGNVRELRNAVHSSSVMTVGDVIGVESLPVEVARGEPDQEFDSSRVSLPVGLCLREVERRMIVATLASQQGNKAKTAEMLGISLKTLYTRLHRYHEAGGA
jgi:DNA-binding NtrC family response regulator